MSFVYKMDVVDALRKAGYTATIIKTNHLFSESTMSKLRRKQSVSWNNLEQICRLLDCQPGDIIEYQKED